ncbi:hypothetical protein ABIB30_000554 [Pedobacter sp. UYP1]
MLEINVVQICYILTDLLSGLEIIVNNQLNNKDGKTGLSLV